MGAALKSMLKSKKFLAALSGLVVVVLEALIPGITLEAEDLTAVLSPILAYIVGQGVADHGKEKEKAKQELAAAQAPKD